MNFKKLLDLRILVAVTIAILVLLLFLFGKQMGLTGERRLLVVIALLLAGMIVLLLKRENKSRESDKIEKSLILEADSMVVTSSGSQRKASEQARDELLRAIEGLKKSRIGGGRSGRSALYVLPWFLVLGRQAAGRSSLVRQSGLSIPGSGPKEGKRERGVGATRNCEWWFTNQAIFLEAHGRFVGFEDESEVGQDWREFLQVLGKARPKLPLNGIVIALSAEDLIRHETTKLEEQARVLRRRLDSLESGLGVICPVYLAVTKTDLIHGFSRYFGDLDSKARGQIWGATFSPEVFQEEDGGRIFRKEFELLYRVLCKRRIARMESEENTARRGEVYLFPLEFLALRKKLQRFVKTLFEPNAYGANPMFRGFYFTSADHEGVPVEMVVNEVSRVIGLPPQWEDDDDRTRVLGAQPSASSSSGASSRSSRSASASAEPHFLRDLFGKLLLADAGIAHPTRRSAKRREVRRLLLQGAAGAAIVILAAGLIVSFARNRSLVKRAVDHAQKASVVTAPAHSGELETKLRALDPMREFLADLDRKEKNRPLTMDMGLFRGKSVNRRARSIYLARLVDVLLGPSRQALESRLFSSYPASPEEHRNYYQDYRAYLMLIEPERAENPFLADYLGTIWSGSAVGAGASQGTVDLIRRHVLYAWDHPGDVAYHSQALPGRNAALLDRASVYIREYWRPDTYYMAMVDEVARIVPSFTLASVPGAEQLLTTNRDLLAADASVSSVPGSFTLKGWNDEMRSRIEDSETRLKSDWVLQEAFQGQSIDMRAWLLETYHKDYRAHWNRFLSAVDVIPPDGVAVAANRVHDLADRSSPLVRLLDVAASNLRFKTANSGESSPKELAAIEDDFAALHALFTVQGEGDNAKRPMDAYLIQLNGVLETLQQRQQSGDVGSSSVQFAKSVLGGTLTEKNAIAEACAFADLHGSGLSGSDMESTTAVGTLLKRAPEAGWRGILADAQRMLDVAWGNDVWGPFHDTLNGKYPFQSGGPDAPLAEFTRFFGPGGVFWNFYDADLAPFLDRDGNAKVMFRHGLLISPESATAIAKAQEFRRALFSDEAAPGKLGLTFRVKPEQTTKVSGQAPYVRTTRFSIGETRIVYDMGLSKETKVSWPGAQGVEGAAVAVTMDGNEPGELNESGPWGLFKLMDKSKITARTDSECEARFRMERAGEYVIEVPYLIRASTVPHPFRASFFQFDCPRQLSPTAGTATTVPPAAAPTPATGA